MKINKEYIAGFIENVGCFNVRIFKKRTGRKDYPLFKIIISMSMKDKVKVMDEINEFFKKNHQFYFKAYKIRDCLIYQIQSDAMILSFIQFLEQNCNITKPKQEQVKEIVEKYKEKKKTKKD